MFYTPKYCSNCSDKIERTSRKLFASEKFCELCETSFRAQEWFPRAIVALGAIFGVVGLFGYFQNSGGGKPLKMSNSVAISNVAAANKALSNQPPAESGSVSAIEQNTASNAAASRAEQNKNSPPAPQNAQPKSAKNQPNVAETVYFCGAETKKGTPCSRRVKGGGRCWQHEGQVAMLSNDKLIASQ